MKNSYIAHGINIEPEGHMAEDKRADIIILSPPGQKLPLELKRDIHDDLWEACESQLDRLYTRDPEACGYGVYVIFWFGEQRKGSITSPPNRMPHPTSSEEMEVMLRELIPPEKRNRLQVIVFDVSPP